MKSKPKSKKIKPPAYEVLDYYLWEYTEYLIRPNGAELIKSKFLKSTKPLRFKKSIKYYSDYLIETSVSLIGAPEKFLKTFKE